MTRDNTLSVLNAHQAELQALGVKSLAIFGSVARNEAHPNSDVDCLVEFSIEASLFDLFKVRHYLEDLLNCDVDLGTLDALREHLKEPVLEDIIYVF